jgi:hypothetical protein
MASPRKTNTNHSERIAILETKVDLNSASLKSIEDQLKSIGDSLSKNKGFWGGAMLMVSALWAFATQLWPHVVSMFTTTPKQ